MRNSSDVDEQMVDAEGNRKHTQVSDAIANIQGGYKFKLKGGEILALPSPHVPLSLLPKQDPKRARQETAEDKGTKLHSSIKSSRI